MKLDKAIEKLTDYLPAHRWPPNTGLEDAMRLGIEALKREKANRKNPDYVMVGPLPGETEG